MSYETSWSLKGEVSGRGRRRRGFTIVELLVVIGVIGLLVALLLPSLSRAREQARIVKCMANLREIGIAFRLYGNDNRGFYPTHSNFGNCFGKKGTTTQYDQEPPTGWADEPGVVEERPLNKYLASPELAHCPSDRGDLFTPGMDTCFESYGTSYLVAYTVDCFGVQHVTGKDSRYEFYRPMKVDMAGDLSIKFVAGDWVWHPNRELTNRRTRWHSNDPSRRRLNMLFGDGHVEFYTFSEEFEKTRLVTWDWYAQFPDVGTRPDPGRGYW